MNIEKYTERARGFIQSAQQLCARQGPPAIRAAAPAQGAARRRGGHGGSVSSSAPAAIPRSCAPKPKPPSSACPRFPAMARSSISAANWRGCSTPPKRGAEGRRLVRDGRAAAAGAGHREGHRCRQDPRLGRRHRRRSSTRRSTKSARAARPIRPRREQYDALKKYARDLTAGGPRGQARSGDRPRRGNPPHHPGAEPPHQEQSGADRRARRRQDRHRRRPRHPHRQWRRARIAQGQEADGARHGRADRRREVSRRVRGAAEGRAQRDHSRPKARSSCSSTRCTRWSAPARPMARWMPRTC
jgi:hypothetical protein